LPRLSLTLLTDNNFHVTKQRTISNMICSHYRKHVNNGLDLYMFYLQQFLQFYFEFYWCKQLQTEVLQHYQQLISC